MSPSLLCLGHFSRGLSIFFVVKLSHLELELKEIKQNVTLPDITFSGSISEKVVFNVLLTPCSFEMYIEVIINIISDDHRPFTLFVVDYT